MTLTSSRLSNKTRAHPKSGISVLSGEIKYRSPVIQMDDWENASQDDWENSSESSNEENIMGDSPVSTTNSGKSAASALALAAEMQRKAHLKRLVEQAQEEDLADMFGSAVQVTKQEPITRSQQTAHVEKLVEKQLKTREDFEELTASLTHRLLPVSSNDNYFTFCKKLFLAITQNMTPQEKTNLQKSLFPDSTESGVSTKSKKGGKNSKPMIPKSRGGTDFTDYGLI